LNEAALARLAAIIESSDDAIIGKDLKGTITNWNLGAERLFGYTAKEAVAQPVMMLVPADRQYEEASIIEQVRNGVPIHHFETVRLKKDGKPIAFSLTISPIRNASGQVIGISTITREITEQKRAEQDREQLLIRKKAARAEAKTANRLKDEF